MNRVDRQDISLRSLLKGIAPAPETTVSDIALDSRQVQPGTLFFAYPGFEADGRDFITDAISRGAAAIVYEPGRKLPAESDVPMVPVQDLRNQVSRIAGRYFGSPSDTLRVIGITGTNGKTSCCYLLAQALSAAGNETGMIGTLGLGHFGNPEPAANTTPDPISIQRELANMSQRGVDYVCMEVSSHALDQGRVSGISFHATVFTNLSQDHLDYHEDMEAYAGAKKRLFTEYPGAIGVINIDDSLGRSLLKESVRSANWTFGENGDVSVSGVELVADGMTLTVAEGTGTQGGGSRSHTVASRLIGRINVPNLAAVITVLRALSISWEEVERIVAILQPAPGRMELITAGGVSPSVVVDYAHTPDALELALSSVREYCQGILWCVFGCGGDRDREKRPLMGAIAENSADRVIVTDDNPRSESPVRIADDILAGMEKPADVMHERGTAILWAISQAGADDWVLVAGKGHETEQLVDDQRKPFSDRDWVHECLGVAA